jgi:hypothetical protein
LASLASASAFIDYTTSEYNHLIPPNTLQETIKLATTNFLGGFICVPAIESPRDNANYYYHYIFSAEGQKVIQEKRKRDGLPDDWWPDLLPFTIALAGIAATVESTRVRRIAGFPEDFTDEIVSMTAEEMTARKEKRTKLHGGVNPDDKYLGPKTPKKTKASKDMSRLEDYVPTVGSVEFPADTDIGIDMYEGYDEEEQLATPTKRA